MSASDILRLFTLLLAATSAALVLLFISYLRKLYPHHANGRSPSQYIAPRVSVFLLALLTLAMVASAVAGAHHIVDVLLVNFVARTVVVACLTGVAVMLLAWQALALEKHYRGRWPKLDAAIEQMLQLGR